jgi:hypothetical protein
MLERADERVIDAFGGARAGEGVRAVVTEERDAIFGAEIGELLDAHVHRVDRERGRGRVRARLVPRQFAEREELHEPMPVIGHPTRERREPADFADAPVVRGSDRKERDEDPRRASPRLRHWGVI